MSLDNLNEKSNSLPGNNGNPVWTYKGKEIQSIEDCPKDAVGFIYQITYRGKIYIGKKALTHRNKKKISKKEKITTGTRKRFKVTQKDSGWLDYYGSSKELKTDVEQYGLSGMKKEILDWACTKSQLSYLEIKKMFEMNVLEIDSYNGNILGRFFRTTPCGCKN